MVSITKSSGKTKCKSLLSLLWWKRHGDIIDLGKGSKHRAIQMSFQARHTHILLLNNYLKIIDDIIRVQLMQATIFSHLPLSPQSIDWFVTFRIGQIFALQKRLSVLLSSQQLSSSRQADFFFLLAEKYLTQLWTKAERIYSHFFLIATRSGIVRMTNSTVQFSGLKTLQLLFQLSVRTVSCLRLPPPGTQGWER